MRTVFMFLGEVVEALIEHFKEDAEFHVLVVDLCDQILTALGMPDVIPGDPASRAGDGQADKPGAGPVGDFFVSRKG